MHSYSSIVLMYFILDSTISRILILQISLYKKKVNYVFICSASGFLLTFYDDISYFRFSFVYLFSFILLMGLIYSIVDLHDFISRWNLTSHASKDFMFNESYKCSNFPNCLSYMSCYKEKQYYCSMKTIFPLTTYYYFMP